MSNLVKRALVRACVVFTAAMALWCAAGLIFAGPVGGIAIALSLLATALLLALLQAIWFTEAVISIRIASPQPHDKSTKLVRNLHLAASESRCLPIHFTNFVNLRHICRTSTLLGADLEQIRTVWSLMSHGFFHRQSPRRVAAAHEAKGTSP